MSDRFFNFIVVILLGCLVVVGSLTISRFCEEKLTSMVPVIDPQAGDVYQQRMHVTRAMLRTAQMKGALQ